MLAGVLLLGHAATASSGDSRTRWPGRPGAKGLYGACYGVRTGKLRLVRTTSGCHRG